MKKLISNNIKVIVAFIIGIVISGITVTAATILYNANEVSYTPSDSDFDATNVNEALNKLYDYHKYIDSMSSSQVVIGSFNATTSQQTIVVGFKPSKVVLYTPCGSTSNKPKISYIYDSNISTTHLITAAYASSSDNGANYGEIGGYGFSVTNDGFTFKSSNAGRVGLTYYYAIK